MNNRINTIQQKNTNKNTMKNFNKKKLSLLQQGNNFSFSTKDFIKLKAGNFKLALFLLVSFLFASTTVKAQLTISGGGSSSTIINGYINPSGCGTSSFFAVNNTGLLDSSPITITKTTGLMNSITIPIASVGANGASEDHLIRAFDASNNLVSSTLLFSNGTTACTTANISGNTVRGADINIAGQTGASVVILSSSTPFKKVIVSNSSSTYAILPAVASFYSFTTPCNAGTTAPTLNSATNFASNTYTIPCGSTTADLSTLTASNLPATTSLTWHTSATATNANKITGTGLAIGTYYAAFWDSTNGCYSPTVAVTVTEANCITANAETYNATAGTTTTASVIANDTNNGTAVTLGATGNSTLTLVTGATGFTLNADGTLSVASTVAAGSYSITYSICDKDVPANCQTATATVTVAAACAAGTTAPDVN